MKKKTTFFNYINPNDVPDFLWEIISKQIDYIEDSEEKLNFISKNIFSFLLKTKHFYLGPVLYNPETFAPLKTICFPEKDLVLKISFTELYTDIYTSYNIANFLRLKKIICRAWETKFDGFYFKTKHI